MFDVAGVWNRFCLTALLCVVLLTGCDGLIANVLQNVQPEPENAANNQNENPPAEVDEDELDEEIQEALEEAKNPLIRGLLMGLNEQEVRDEAEDKGYDLIEILLAADKKITQYKEENRKAIEYANRQVIINKCRTPNVVMIVADGLLAGDLEPYGNQDIPAPHLAAVSSRGALFTHFYAGHPTSVGCRVALDRGRFLSSPTLPVSIAGDTSGNTIPEMMWQAGYNTFFVGAWGATLENLVSPSSQSFDHWYGVLMQEEAGKQHPRMVWRDDQPLLHEVKEDDTETPPTFSELIVAETRRVLKTNCPKQRPFYLQVHLPAAAALPETGDQLVQVNHLPEAARQVTTRVTALDTLIGNIVADLETAGATEDTVLMITGSPGSSLSASEQFPDRVSEFATTQPLSDGNLRVPLLVKWPREIPGGRVIGTPCGHWDLFPTLASIAKRFPFPKRVQGEILLPLIKPGAEKPEKLRERLLIWKAEINGELTQAVRYQQWKGINPAGTKTLKLFNLETDPGETRDVAAEHPEILSKMIKPSTPQKK